MARIASRAAASLVVLALMSCESAISDDEGTDRLTQSDWAAQSIMGQAVIKPGRVTLSFGDGRVSGRGGCNLYSGPVEYGGGMIKVGPLISTKMACMEAGLMQQEIAYLNALQAAERYSVSMSGRLTITTRQGAIVYDSTPRQVRPEG